MNMTPVEVIESDLDWLGAYQRLMGALLGENALPTSEPGKPLEGCPMTPLEEYARAVADTSSPGISLALSLPLTMVATSMATQGGVWLNVEQPGGYMLKVPAIMQATVMAPSGYGKSTIVDPLTDALKKMNTRGIGDRRKLVSAKIGKRLAELESAKQAASAGGKKAGKLSLAQSAAQVVVSEGDDEKSIRALYAYGLCKSFVLDSGTPEGVRRALLRGGGMAGIFTAEPDVLREISSYAKDGGTFRWLLDGWGGSSIGVARADREMVVPRTCLPYAIVVQPTSFDQFNTARQQQEGGQDSAIGRGLYGRSWLVRITGWEAPGAAFGMGFGPGAAERVSTALAEMEKTFEVLVSRTNPYRAEMGVVIGWEESSSKDEEGDADAPGLPDPVTMTLAEDAVWDYTMMQNVRLAFIEEVSMAEAGKPGLSKLLMPMVTRLTQHALRIAMLLQLSHDPHAEKLEAWAVRDASLRLLPWLIDHWAAEMHKYASEGAQTALEFEIRNNFKGEEFSFDSRITLAIGRVVAAKGGGEGVQFTQGEVVAAAKAQVRSSARIQLSAEMHKSFERVVKLGWIETVEGSGGGGRAGSVKFVRSPLGLAAGL